jgi:hypothetical protein
MMPQKRERGRWEELSNFSAVILGVADEWSLQR